MLESGTKEYDFFASKKALICDESHLVAAETLERVCSGVLKDIPYRMFMSGTNVRGDGKDIVLQGVIGPWVYELDTKTAIEGGFLCPLKFTVIKTFSPTNKKEIDPMKTKRTHFLYNKEVAKKIALIANSSANKLNESSLILVEELRQIADIIKLLEVPYAYCHSASKKDASEWGLEQVNTKDSIEKFNSGEVKVIIGTSCIDTGVNLYPCHNTFNWVGGSSEVTTKQGTIGRSVRKLENSKYKQFHKPKPVSKVYDFDVEGQPILQSQLRRRLEFYKETGCPVIIV
jgi:superfamily II DNA or RNA helicase